MQLVIRPRRNTDRPELRQNEDRQRPDGGRTGGKNPPGVRNRALWLVCVIEERVDGGFDGRAKDAGTSGVGNCRQIASVRFSDSQASRQ